MYRFSLPRVRNKKSGLTAVTFNVGTLRRNSKAGREHRLITWLLNKIVPSFSILRQVRAYQTLCPITEPTQEQYEKKSLCWHNFQSAVDTTLTYAQSRTSNLWSGQCLDTCLSKWDSSCRARRRLQTEKEKPLLSANES